MIKVDAKDFSLSWWRINKSELNISKKDKATSTVAITINSATRKEIKSIASWCDSNPVHKRYRLETWDDAYRYGDETFVFMNNQMTVIAEPDVMSDLEKWLSSIPERNNAIMLSMKLADLRKITRKYDVRIITDLNDENNHIVSMGDSMLATELVLRSD